MPKRLALKRECSFETKKQSWRKVSRRSSYKRLDYVALEFSQNRRSSADGFPCPSRNTRSCHVPSLPRGDRVLVRSQGTIASRSKIDWFGTVLRVGLSTPCEMTCKMSSSTCKRDLLIPDVFSNDSLFPIQNEPRPPYNFSLTLDQN